MLGPVREIVVLPAELANQIAAGEVVERPASIVKELVENALDAEATRITVSIEGGGIDLIEVADDGFGMDEANARRALLRHATSKLRSFDELLSLSSYGFRGEALPSIASVSRFALETRARKIEQGLRLEKIDAGLDVRPLGRPVGTTIVVRDLFHNVPARRKFLKSSGTEAAHVSEVVLAAALTRPEVGFELFREGRLARRYPRAASREERARDLWEEFPLSTTRTSRGPVSIEAYLADPASSQKGTSGLRIVVNGRAVRDRSIAGTVAHAFGETLPRGHFPRGVVYLDLPPALVDVNVHPQKLEVRFAESRPLLEALHSSLRPDRAPSHEGPRSAASSFRSFARAAAGLPPTKGLHGATETALSSLSPPAHVVRDSTPVPAWAAFRDATQGADSKASESERPEAEFRLLGAHPSGFLVAEDARGVHAVDPHALYEIVHHERIVASLEEEGALPARPLLFPLRVALEPRASATLERFETFLAADALVVRTRPDRTVEVVAVPDALADIPAEVLVRSILGRIERSAGEARPETVREVLLSLAPEFACISARRSPLDPSDALRRLPSARYASECVHGRVVIAALWASEIARKLIAPGDPG